MYIAFSQNDNVHDGPLYFSLIKINNECAVIIMNTSGRSWKRNSVLTYDGEGGGSGRSGLNIHSKIFENWPWHPPPPPPSGKQDYPSPLTLTTPPPSPPENFSGSANEWIKMDSINKFLLSQRHQNVSLYK